MLKPIPNEIELGDESGRVFYRRRLNFDRRQTHYDADANGSRTSSRRTKDKIYASPDSMDNQSSMSGLSVLHGCF